MPWCEPGDNHRQDGLMTDETKMTEEDGMTLNRPLDEHRFQALQSKVSGTYLRRRSDHSFSNFLDQSLRDREVWRSNRDALRDIRARIDAVHADGTDPDPDDVDLFTSLQKLVAAYRPRGFVVTGASGAGKSRLVDEALSRRNPALMRRGRSLPLLYLEVPGPCTLRTLGLELSRALGYPVAPKALEHEIWDVVRAQLALADVSVLYLDEIQNVTEGANVKEAPRILNTLKNLMKRREHPVILVMAGLLSFTGFAEDDDQVRRRIDFVPLETLTLADAPTITNAVERLAGHAGLHLGEGFESGVIPRLIHAGQSQFGMTMEIAVEAVLCAARPLAQDGKHLPPADSLDISHFATVFARRTGNAGFANPFVAPNWHTLDVSRVGVVSRNQLSAGDEPAAHDNGRSHNSGEGRR